MEAISEAQISFQIEPSSMTPDQYCRAQTREAYEILSRLHVIYGTQLPNNILMALAFLGIETYTSAAGQENRDG